MMLCMSSVLMDWVAKVCVLRRILVSVLPDDVPLYCKLLYRNGVRTGFCNWKPLFVMNHTPAKRVNARANSWEIAWVMIRCWDPLFARFLCSQLSRAFLVQSVFRRVHKIAKNNYYFRHVRLSVFSCGTTRLPLDGFSWHLIFSENLSRKFKFH
jgi:hypothetical protein